MEYLLFVLTSVFILANALQGEIEEMVELREVSSKPDWKTPNEMPSTMTLRISRPSDVIILKLARTDPIPETHGEDDVTSSEEMGDVFKSAAVYTDVEHGGNFIVRGRGNECFVRGSFLYDSEEVSLHPVRRTKDGRNLHRMTRYQRDIGQQEASMPPPRATPAPVRHVVETIFVADYSVYTRAQTLYGKTGNALIEELQLWYTFIANMIASVYRNIVSTTFSLNVKVIGIKIATSAAQAPWTERDMKNRTVLDTTALGKFQDWFPVQSDIPEVDHVMGFTVYDLVDEAENSTPVGVTPLAGLCDGVSGSSVIEEDFSATTAGTAAHELAHNLGAIHDEDTVACKTQKFFLMATNFEVPPAPTQAARPWRFSNCSVTDIKAFLDLQTCTLTQERPGPRLTTNRRAGQYVSGDRQCRFKMGRNAAVCRSEYGMGALLQYEDVCRVLVCCNSSGNIEELQALDFTTCGQRKWCVQGLCVVAPQVLAGPDSCPLGDSPFSACRAAQCEFYDRPYHRECCTSCAAFLT